jgi:MFS family permease
LNTPGSTVETRQGYVVTAAAFWLQMLGIGSLVSFGIFIPALEHEFGWSRATVAGAASIANLVNGVLAMGAGYLSDRYGPRIVMTIAGIILGSAYFLMSQTQAIWQLYLAYGVLYGIGWSAFDVVPLSTVAKRFSANRGVMTGIVKAGAGAGMFAVPLLVGGLVSGVGWRWALVALGVLVLVGVSAAARFLRLQPAAASEENTSEATAPATPVGAAMGLTLHQAFHTRQFWIMCVMYLLVYWCSFTIVVHISPHAVDLGLSTVAAASMISVIGISSIVGRLTTGKLIDRIGLKRTMTISLVGWVLAYTWLQLQGGIWMLYVFAVVYGFNHGGLFTAVSPKIAELFGTRAHGSIFGAVLVSSAFGGAIGPYLAGRMFELTGNYKLVFVILAILSVMMIGLNLTLRPVAAKGQSSLARPRTKAGNHRTRIS